MGGRLFRHARASILDQTEPKFAELNLNLRVCVRQANFVGMGSQRSIRNAPIRLARLEG